MNSEKQKRLEAKGWELGGIGDFLDLSPEESIIIEM